MSDDDKLRRLREAEKSLRVLAESYKELEAERDQLREGRDALVAAQNEFVDRAETAEAERDRLRAEVEALKDQNEILAMAVDMTGRANERLRAVVDAALVEARAAREKEAGPVDLFAEVIERRLAAALDVSGNMGRSAPPGEHGQDGGEADHEGVGEDEGVHGGQPTPAGAAPEDVIDRALDMPGPVAETGADLNRMSRPAPETFVSKTGEVLTEADLDALADAAECAHDANMSQPTCPCPCHQANATPEDVMCATMGHEDVRAQGDALLSEDDQRYPYCAECLTGLGDDFDARWWPLTIETPENSDD